MQARARCENSIVETERKSDPRGGGLNEHSDLRDEHGRCPWRCPCVTIAPDVRISTDTIGMRQFYLERVGRCQENWRQRNKVKCPFSSVSRNEPYSP